MAERRMFAKSIVLSDAFLDMPLGSRALYMSLNILSDDEGVVNNPKSIMRQCGATIDDLNVLIAKKFLIPFEKEGVIVIKHWYIHNYIQKDRFKPSKYHDLIDTLSLDENNAYTQACIQNVSKVDTQVRLEIGKSKDIDNNKHKCVFRKPTLEEVIAYCKERKNNIDPQAFIDYYESVGWKIGNKPMKDFKACVRTWEQRRNEKSKDKIGNVKYEMDY